MIEDPQTMEGNLVMPSAEHSKIQIETATIVHMLMLMIGFLGEYQEMIGIALTYDSAARSLLQTGLATTLETWERRIQGLPDHHLATKDLIYH